MAVHEDVLLSTDTDLEHYLVVERIYEGRPSRVLFSGQRRAAQSGVGLDDNPDLLFDYNQRFLELANALYPKSILVLGGGGFTLPMALLTALPDATIEVVERDAGLERIARDFFGLREDPRLTIHFTDARTYTEQTNDTYDLIIIDVFSELAIPRHMLTVEFIRLLYEKLNAGGCAALNIIASYQGRNTALIRSQVAAYGKFFDTLEIYPAEYGMTTWLPQNLVLTAQKNPTHDVKDYLRFAAMKQITADAADIYYDADNENQL